MKRKVALQRNQQGAVLIVSLIMLLVLTLLGVAGMNSSVMQERMAANNQNGNRAFQAAESAAGALTAQLLSGNLDVLEVAMAAADKKSTPTDFSLGRSDVTAEYYATYMGEVAVTSGSSMDVSESAPILKGFRYELTGTATIDGAGATRTVHKGIEYN